MRGCLVLLLVLPTTVALAQGSPLPVRRVMSFSNARSVPSAELPVVLRQPLRLTLRSVTIEQALHELTTRAGLDLAFGRGIVPLDRVVSVTVKDGTVADALGQILRDVPVELWIAGDGRMALVPVTAVRSDSLGWIDGVVTDSLDGRPVSNVNVLLKGSKIGTVTHADGAYRLHVPRAGGTLVLYRIGYPPREVPYGPGTTTLNVVLSETPISLSAVQVAATARRLQPVEHTSDQAVVAEIKSSTSVVSGISSEQIAKSADVNAAQIVRHISGVTVTDESFLVVRGMNQRYNATYLDDNLAPSTELYSRAFDLSLIPDRIVDKILVYKSPRADLIGDMTGAAVKIYTKDALAVRRFDVALRVGYRPSSTGKDMLSYSGGKTDWLGIDDGTRSLPSDVPGFGDFRHAVLSQSQYISSFSPVLGDKVITAPPDFQLTLSYYDNFSLGRMHLYTVTSASYTFETRYNAIYQQQGNSQIGGNPSSSRYINTIEHDEQGSQKANLNLMQNVTLRVNDDNQIYFKNFLLQQGTSLTADQIKYPNDSVYASGGGTPRTGVFGTWNRNIVLDWEQRLLYQGNIGGTHDLTSNQSLAWNLGLTASLHTIPDQRTTRFQNSDLYYSDTPNYNNPENFNNSWVAIDRGGQQAGGVFDQTGTISRIWTRNAEQLYNGSFDYTLSPAKWLDMKVGSYDYVKVRSVARREYLVYDGELALNTPNITQELTYTNPGWARYVNGNLIHFRPQDLNKVWSNTYFPNDMTGLAVVDATQPTDAYEASEGYAAGYLMTNLKPFNGHVEINGGVRVEYDQLHLAAAQFAGGGFGGGANQSATTLAIPVFVDDHAVSWLPSVNVAWRPSPKFVARAAYGKTVNRPEFREISPFTDYNYQDNTIITGNPTLVKADIDNYDVRLEVYPTSHGDAWSVGAFYKTLRNPIERLDETTNTTFSGESFLEQITYGNAPKATVEGLEAEARQSLFWHLSAVASGALIHSHVSRYAKDTVGVTFYDRPLQGQAPYVLDAGLFYDNPRIGTKVGASYTVSGTSIYAVGATKNDPTSGSAFRGSILELPRGLLELAVTQSFGSAWRLKVSAQNLLNEAIRFAQDENFNSTYQPEHLVNGKYVGDNIYRRYNPGQYFLLSITRSF
ncbi:MAG TPA: TonB-dependent receptor [Gemmatimonadaceae bacterium]|nr:TonB-dependent receptor [Gemmatimonadaceae bacterium]